MHRPAGQTTASSGDDRSRLACCHGYHVAAGELVVGAIETPVFADAAAVPDYLVVRGGAAIGGGFRVVPVSLVSSVDADGRTVSLQVDAATLATLPEQLPLVAVPVRTNGA